MQHAGFPELRVDGKPFFVHSAVFFYYRVPRDLWENSLDRYHDLGINTIDLPIPWNWHEPRQGEFDFDGHANPRRDLRGLLQLISAKGFKLIVRAGPVIGTQWRHGGYPDWLLARPEYNMDAGERAAGEYPPLAELVRRDAEAAAKGWLENPTHMAAARNWLAALARELTPYSAGRKVRVAPPSDQAAEAAGKEISGPLLYVQLDDSPGFDPANPAARTGSYPEFHRYLSELRGGLEAGGLETIYTINPVGLLAPRWTVQGTSSSASPSRQGIGFTGQWFLPLLPPDPNEAVAAGRRLTAPDASILDFLAATLGTQPDFPPLVSDYQAGWFAPADDVRPRSSSPANTLLSSRLLFARGLHGLDYFPLQDTLTPAGYEVPAANRYFRWDAALDLGGNRQPRSLAVARNAGLLALWGEWLAGSHPRADFGLVDPRHAVGYAESPPGALERADLLRIAQALMQIQRVAQLAGLSSELLDPEAQGLESLLRHAVVFLPVLDTPQERLQLSQHAQALLVEYVRRGGTLILFPGRPAGKLLEPLWSTPAPGAAGEAAAAWSFGQGRVVEWTKDFYSWAPLSEDFAENRARFEAAWATAALRKLLTDAGVRPAVKRSGGKLLMSELVPNEGTGEFGARQPACPTAGLCRAGLVSVTNLDYDAPAEETFQVLAPGAGSRGSSDDYLSIHVQLPARESLLLPLHYPLCSSAAAGETCADEIVAAGAELLHVERDSKTLELTFYAPARASILLRLESSPAKISLPEGNLEGQWKPETHQIEIALPRGASPKFERVLKLHLRYTPHVPQKPDARKHARHDFDAEVMDAVRLPLGEDASLASFPPLVVLDSERKGQLLFGADNFDEMGRSVNVSIEGAVRGAGRFALDPGEVRIEKISLGPGKSSDVPAEPNPGAGEGLLTGQAVARSGRLERSTPIYFATVGDSPTGHYRYDFDRDAAPEWVLENDAIRLILSPEDGGRAIALVDKSSGSSVITLAGTLHDLFAPAGNALGVVPVRLYDATFNRAYRAEWISESVSTAGVQSAGSTNHSSPSAHAGPPNNPPVSTAVRLSYAATEPLGSGKFPAEARIEKTVRLAGTNSVEADYSVSLAASSGSAAESAAFVFLVMTSVPARGAGELSTRFCWTPSPATQEGSPAQGSKELPTATAHCEIFAPDKGVLELPDGVRRIEARTPGRPGLALEWPAGQMTIEMKSFSALLKLRFPALGAGSGPTAEPAAYRLRYTVLPVE